MYAIADISGKQYKVEVGANVTVDRLNAEVGEVVSFPVLLVVDGEKVEAGNPVVKDVVVKAKVLSHVQDKKIVVYKYKAKKNERKKQGHRQPYTKISIESIG
ncbi:MAG: 50S ribosomal protein L21 [Candidatus Onthoplasma sp.]